MKSTSEKMAKINIAIFSATSKKYGFGRNFELKKSFTPLQSDVEQAERALWQDLGNINPQKSNEFWPIIHENMNSYKRQYFGYIEEKGDKILFINCFWIEDRHCKGWQTEPFICEGGGSYIWNIKFAIEAGKLFDLCIHGCS